MTRKRGRPRKHFATAAQSAAAVKQQAYRDRQIIAALERLGHSVEALVEASRAVGGVPLPMLRDAVILQERDPWLAKQVYRGKITLRQAMARLMKTNLEEDDQ